MKPNHNREVGDRMSVACARILLTKFEDEGKIDKESAERVYKHLRKAMAYQDVLAELVDTTAQPQCALRAIKSICCEFV